MKSWRRWWVMLNLCVLSLNYRHILFALAIVVAITAPSIRIHFWNCKFHSCFKDMKQIAKKRPHFVVTSFSSSLAFRMFWCIFSFMYRRKVAKKKQSCTQRQNEIPYSQIDRRYVSFCVNFEIQTKNKKKDHCKIEWMLSLDHMYYFTSFVAWCIPFEISSQAVTNHNLVYVYFTI